VALSCFAILSATVWLINRSNNYFADKSFFSAKFCGGMAEKFIGVLGLFGIAIAYTNPLVKTSSGITHSAKIAELGPIGPEPISFDMNMRKLTVNRKNIRENPTKSAIQGLEEIVQDVGTLARNATEEIIRANQGTSTFSAVNDIVDRQELEKVKAAPKRAAALIEALKAHKVGTATIARVFTLLNSQQVKRSRSHALQLFTTQLNSQPFRFNAEEEFYSVAIQIGADKTVHVSTTTLSDFSRPGSSDKRTLSYWVTQTFNFSTNMVTTKTRQKPQK
jgi:hypothetical protein